MTRKLSFAAAGTLTLAAFVLISPVSARLSAHLAGDPQAGERTIYVSVMNSASGAPIPDMKAEEFVVKEDGAAREVVSATRATAPLSYALLVDTSTQAIPAALDIREAVKAFCELLLSAEPKTQISVTEFGGQALPKRPLTSSITELEETIGKIVPSKSSPVLNEALVTTAKDMSKMPADARKVIIALSMEPAPDKSGMEQQFVGEEVRKSGVTVWSVQVADGGKRDSARENLMKIVAGNSGGRAMTIQNRNQLSQVLRVFAANSFSQYAVKIKGAGDKVKMTDVTVTRPESVALAMKWSK